MDSIACDVSHHVLRSLLSDHADHATEGVADAGETCYCLPHHSHGTNVEHHVAMTCSYIALSCSVAILLFYAYHYFQSRTGWEEVYVCLIELVKVLLEIFAETYAPATILQVNGVNTTWLRYAEWLLTCPVILIHLSNITGLHNNYNKRTMTLLISDVGTIVAGITSAFATGPAKVVFFCVGICYGCNTFFTASKVYLDAHKEVPEGRCQTLVKLMAWVFFSSWLSFPLLFLMGPEGFGHISPYGSIIGHTIVDLMSKNLWGLIGHHLRNLVADHVRQHGRLTGFYSTGGTDPAKGLASPSRIMYQYEDMGATAVIQSSMTTKGKLGTNSLVPGKNSSASQVAGAAANLVPGTSPVRVVLGATDTPTVEHFRDQVGQLTVPVEVTPAIGADAIAAAAIDANGNSVDVVLLNPDLCASGLVPHLKASGIRVVVYGWTQAAATYLGSLDIDDFVEGPTLGIPLNIQQLSAALAQAQAAKEPPPVAPTTGTSDLLRAFSNTSGSPTPAPPSSNPLGRSSSPLPRASSLSSANPFAAPAANPTFTSNPNFNKIASFSSGIAPNGGGATPFGNASSTARSSTAPATPAEGPVRTASRLSFDKNLGTAHGSAPAQFSNTSGIPKTIRTGPSSPRSPRGGVSESLTTRPWNAVDPAAAAGAANSSGTSAGSAPTMEAAAAAAGVRAPAGLNEAQMLQQLLKEIARLKQEVGEDGF